jgi:ABC-type multidrug transport system fused ATPase/permease subunit
MNEAAGSGFIAVEKRATGSLGVGFYSRYLSSVQGIVWMAPLLIFLIVTENFFANGFRWLVSLWVEGCTGNLCNTGDGFEAHFRRFFSDASPQRGLSFLSAFILFAVFYRALTWTIVTGFLARGGRALHDKVVSNLAYVPVTFYDENPTGRIVRRFSGDYSNLLTEIPNYINDIFGCIAEIVWIFILVALQAPVACLSSLPCALVYFRVQSMFRPASRELQRLSKVLETPFWSLFTECVSGMQTIRSYGRVAEFQQRLKALQMTYALAFLAQNRLTRWLNVRLKLTSELFGLVVTIFVVWALAEGRMGVGVAGFLMSLSIGLDSTMQWLTRSFSMIESTMVSLERILEYRQLPTERLSATAPAMLFEKRIAGAEIVFKDYSARYRSGLPRVLGDVSVTIRAGDRVGIIGRTGAGKSTLFQALYQMLQVDSGSVHVNGLPLDAMPLAEGRSLFAIVPQEPHLFAGTLRHNLDRLGIHADERLWQVLEAVRMAAFVRSMWPAGLESPILERGANISVGQRQLICFARALLLDSPIVLMDEPTASVDPETDAAIQSAVRHLFRGKTILIIAHRLETVQDCHQVLMMDQGRLIAQGSPAQILPQWMSAADADSLLV